MNLLKSLRAGLLSLFCVCAVIVGNAPQTSMAHDGFGLSLAQVAPTPPANVRPVGKMYVVEGIVIALLFGGALYAVCRASRRT